MTHAAVHGNQASSTNSTSQQSSATTGQEINVREVSAAAGVEAAPRIVHAARLMEAAGQAEMRVSVKSDVAGSVDVRAMLEGDHITATVATQHDGTRDWMMANVHELHSSLSRDDMNLKSFEVSNSGLQFSGQNQPRQQEQQQQQQQSRAYSNFADESNTVSSAMNTDIDTEETASRALSLLA
jgi:flagellar hook-length control protein FliK